MSDDARVVLSSGKMLRVGDVDWVLSESADVRPVLPTFLVETRHVGQVIYLSLAETVIDAHNGPEARVCSRLRLDIVTAQILRDALSDLIKKAQEPVSKSQSN